MKKFIFMVCLSALVLTGCTKVIAPKVGGRYVPERKDDFAWENEYAAFRMYGPALANENPSNGVDLWLKNSPALAVDSMYSREINEGRPYHINYNGNLDCYKVAHTAGCGGLVIWAEGDSSLSIGGPYTTWEILEQTPEKFVFRLTYDSVPVCDQIMKETITITAEAGKLLNKAEVVLMCPTKIRLPQLYVGGGIFLHDSIGNIHTDSVSGMVAYAEDALSDKTAAQLNFDYNGSTTQGRDYVAILVPGAVKTGIMDNTAIALRPYDLGDTLTYWFGASWSEWSNGTLSFPTDADWFNFVDQEIRKLQ